ncbi:hypothetical protein TEA_019104 [Camellia sinensis var. sinensis]|uniref:Uncharacterized protein n=1 Tax=Camellia sinensis var. sinensis TaxID=542762 RepID=A0A4S4DA26_CAMSN|nr:hypothetical protein TEA_019104 [Camellia sinensis var. sinensis]
MYHPPTKIDKANLFSHLKMTSSQAGDVVNGNAEPTRHLAKFPPSLWGDRFTSFTLDKQSSRERERDEQRRAEAKRGGGWPTVTPVARRGKAMGGGDGVIPKINSQSERENPEPVWDMYGNEIVVLKEQVRSMVVAGGCKAAEQMNLISVLERLGVSYHFEKEIEEQLGQLFAKFEDNEDFDLFTIALHFRIFRQHGYKMSCDSNGQFKETVSNDVKGMLSLYEATYLKIHGEGFLDEAHANLGLWGFPRLEAKHFISFYEKDASRNETLLRLAKLDFNQLQLSHREELCHISRWDVSPMDELPDYMKALYRALLNVYDEVERDLAKQGRAYGVHHSKEAEEQERGHVATGLDCYMKQHGVSKQEAIVELYKMIENAWRDINEEMLKPTAISMKLLIRVLNLSRISDVVYKYVDGYTHPEIIKDHVISLFEDPIPI